MLYIIIHKPWDPGISVTAAVPLYFLSFVSPCILKYTTVSDSFWFLRGFKENQIDFCGYCLTSSQVVRGDNLVNTEEESPKEINV